MTITFGSDRNTDKLIRLYREAETQLSLKVERAIISGALGTASYRQAQLTEIHQILAGLGGQAVPEAISVLQGAYREGIQIGNLAGIQTGFTGIHQNAVETLTQSMGGRLTDGLNTVGRRVDDVFAREGMRLSALHLAQGSTRTEASAALVDTLTSQGIASFTDRAGRDWGLATYSEMVVRTTTREAASVATKNRLIEGGIDLVEWTGNGENCDQCSALDGEVFSLTGETDGYPMMEDLPPLHPRCTCILAPASVTFDQLEKEFEPRDAEPPATATPATPPEPPAAETALPFDKSLAPQDIGAAVEGAGADLAGLLDDLPAPPPLHFGKLPNGTLGSYSPSSRTISISTDVPAARVRSTAHHEYGHLIDLQRTGDVAEAALARRELLRVIRRSDAVKDLREISKGLSGADKAHLRYLLSDVELVARAFQRWVAEKQGGGAMESFRAAVESHPRPNDLMSRLADARFFEHDDFAPIETALRAWMQTKGWLR